MRVFSRLTGYDRDIADPKHVGFFWQVAEGVLQSARPRIASGRRRPGQRYGDINQSLMELGALVCTPTRPACLMCPVREFCRAFAEGRQEELPVKRKKAGTPVVRGTAVVVVRSKEQEASSKKAGGRRKPEAGSQEVLLMRRPVGGVWAEMWEFPVLGEARSQKPGARSIEAILGVRVRCVRDCGRVSHQLTHRRFELEVVCCEAASEGEVRLAECLGAGSEGRYVASRWVGWPVERGGALPLAKLVHKVAGVVK
jgi:A/G-specific adenine glycosylase